MTSRRKEATPGTPRADADESRVVAARISMSGSQPPMVGERREAGCPRRRHARHRAVGQVQQLVRHRAEDGTAQRALTRRSWERDSGWSTTEPSSEPEVFDFPEGIGPVGYVNVEHEELLVPCRINAQRVTFEYGFGASPRCSGAGRGGRGLQHPSPVEDVEAAPRDLVARSTA